MKLKYAEDLARIINCPPPEAAACNRGLAYRFVHDTIEDERNFQPPAKLNPSRRFKDDEECCAAHALSMFSTEAKAAAFFADLRKVHKNIHKTIGGSIAEGRLDGSDGLSTAPDESGHFDLFQADGVDFSKSFSIIQVLVQ